MNTTPTIPAGTIVTLRPEYRDPGDENYVWRVVEDRCERVLVSVEIPGFKTLPMKTLPREAIES